MVGPQQHLTAAEPTFIETLNLSFLLIHSQGFCLTALCLHILLCWCELFCNIMANQHGRNKMKSGTNVPMLLGWF